MKRSVLAAGLAAVVILIAGILVLTFWPEKEPEAEQVFTPPPVVSTVADLIRVPPESLDNIQFIPDNGSSYKIWIDRSSGEILLGPVEDLIFQGQPIALFAVMTHATSLTGLTVVAEEADDTQLAMFGFNDPAMTLIYSFPDNTTVEVQVGATQAAGHSRYARIKDSREVLLLNEMQSTVLALPVEDLYDITFFPHWLYADMDSAVADISHVVIESESRVIEIRKRMTLEDFEGTQIGSSVYHFLQPHKADANDSLVQRLVMEDIVTVLPNHVVTARPADLSVYGLDNPVRLTIGTALGEWSGTLLIGDRSTEQRGRYVMIEGFDAVLIDMNSDYAFLDARFSQMRSSMIWLVYIDEVSSVEFKLDDVTRILTLDFGGGDEPMLSWLDDEKISEQNARRLFEAALMIIMSGETDEPIPPRTTPVYSITMNMRFSADEKIDLYRINDSQFLIVHNDVNTGLFITRMALQENILNRFETIDAGGELS